MQSDNLLLDLGLQRVIDVPQLFYAMSDGKLSVVVAKIVDDILATGENNAVDQLLERFNSKFKFGTVIHGPGRLRYFGFNISQHEDFKCSLDGDDKLFALEPVPLTRLRRKAATENLNEIEKPLIFALSIVLLDGS